MKFWDSSAIIPLLVKGNHTERLLALLQDDPVILVWTLTSVECLSALHCHARNAEKNFDSSADAFASRLRRLQDTWAEIQQISWVKKRAERLMSVHAIRTNVALQLAAALIACEDRPEDLPLVTLDPELGSAARREGFQVLRPED